MGGGLAWRQNSTKGRRGLRILAFVLRHFEIRLKNVYVNCVDDIITSPKTRVALILADSSVVKQREKTEMSTGTETIFRGERKRSVL